MSVKQWYLMRLLSDNTYGGWMMFFYSWANEAESATPCSLKSPVSLLRKLRQVKYGHCVCGISCPVRCKHTKLTYMCSSYSDSDLTTTLLAAALAASVSRTYTIGPRVKFTPSPWPQVAPLPAFSDWKYRVEVLENQVKTRILPTAATAKPASSDVTASQQRR